MLIDPVSDEVCTDSLQCWPEAHSFPLTVSSFR